jgi:hypothetical protein
MQHDELLQNHLLQSMKLDFILAEFLCENDYMILQLFTLDFITVFKSIHVCMIHGKVSELEQLIRIFQKKLEDFVNTSIPSLLSSCKEHKTHHEKRMN